MIEVAITIIKHDKFQFDLIDTINEEYDVILTNISLYSKRNRKVGEIDILAYKGDYCDIIEVKCSHRIIKARKQLTKLRKIVSQSSKVRNTYMFCGATQELILV
ncbi:MAG: hypothetical protein ACMXYK_02875 [Candidatus Woesearchaeota archaeon]